nr:sigma-70 family RNA polymerase sigma factor [Clostridia bacterium]
EEFGQRITSAQGRMYRVARGYLRGEQDCLDAISEAICKAWQKRGALRDEQVFDPWLTRILIRECINVQRKQKRMIPVETLPEETALPSDNEELRQALDALPQKLRVPVVLHYMEGYDVKEVASILHTTKGAVCSRLFHARSRLRALLKEEIE